MSFHPLEREIMIWVGVGCVRMSGCRTRSLDYNKQCLLEFPLQSTAFFFFFEWRWQTLPFQDEGLKQVCESRPNLHAGATHSSLSRWQNFHPSALMRAMELLLRNNCWREVRPYREPLFTSVRLLNSRWLRETKLNRKSNRKVGL